MKNFITFLTASAIILMFSACDSSKKGDFAGYWLKGESDILFEVIKNEDQFIIRNVNGDLSAEIRNGKLCGENSLKMTYCMTVKGDSAYYEFADIVTGYKRINKSEYEKISATKTRASFKPSDMEVPAETGIEPVETNSAVE